MLRVSENLKPSDSITRKFVDSIDLSDYEILTDTGWCDATHIHKTIEYREWVLVLENGLELICADDHIVFDDRLHEVFVKNLRVGDKIMTVNGAVKVASAFETNESSHMFDITVDSPDHRFYTNGILSHNTTVAVAIILHYILFNEYKVVALLANKADTAREIMNRIQIAYEALPDWLQSGVEEWNKGSLTLENGCKVIAAATSSSAIRGKSISLLYCDEVAFIENWEEFSASILPTISSGETTKMLFSSTPNGLNHFYAIFSGAKENINGWAWVEVPWTRVPGRDDNWKEEALQQLNYDQQKFAQEYEMEFQGSSGTLIDGSTLKSLTKKIPLHESQGLAVYTKPEKDHTYVCIADVSRGKGLDYSAFHIIDVTSMPYKQVVTYRNNFVTPVDYADIIFRTTKSYNDAYVLVEINDIGGQVSDTLHFDFEVETLLYTESAGRAGKRISGGFGSNVDKGIRTTKQVKSIGCSILKLLVEQKQLLISDFNTINELSTFSKKGSSYEAEPGCHDDLVMGLVLFAWLSTQAFFKDITDINTMMKLREKSDEEIMDELLPFGFTYDDLEHAEPVYTPSRGSWIGDW